MIANHYQYICIFSVYHHFTRFINILILFMLCAKPHGFIFAIDISRLSMKLSSRCSCFSTIVITVSMNCCSFNLIYAYTYCIHLRIIHNFNIIASHAL